MDFSGLIIFPQVEGWNALVAEYNENCQHYFDSVPPLTMSRHSRTQQATRTLQPTATDVALAKSARVLAEVSGEVLVLAHFSA